MLAFRYLKLAARLTANQRTFSSFSAAATLKVQVSTSNIKLAQGQGPLALFEQLVAIGQLNDDVEQRRVLEYLNAMFHSVQKRTARGLYLYGSVGCGKTMSMDLFFSSIKDMQGIRVLRKHFHDFLHDVQIELHKNRLGPPQPGHPVERVGLRIAKMTDVLCFDEFAVTTIQDCVLLMPLFSVLFNQGVTIVATSNRAPEELYSDGLNRHLYLPKFLETLQHHCRIHEMKSSTDYRALHYQNSFDAGVFCWPTDRNFVDRWFAETTNGFGGQRSNVSISYGRSMEVAQVSACGRIARLPFQDICGKNFSADDYSKICNHFHTLLLDDVPKLTVDNHNEARRFTTLVDNCYEHNVRLICSMEGPPEEILGGLRGLRDMSLSVLSPSEGVAGCGDGDTSPSSSGVLQAIERIKLGLSEQARERSKMPTTTFEHMSALDVLGSELKRVQQHGDADMDVWRQSSSSSAVFGGPVAPPQVSKSWDDRRRISAFTWESQDPTSEQQTIKGVFAAAVASLKESGFAVERAISRLREMQTDSFQQNHKLKRLSE